MRWPWQRSLTAAQAKPKRMARSFGGVLSGMFKAGMVDTADRWTATPVPPDQFISLRQPQLVARSREQWSNNDYMRSFVRLVGQNVSGLQGIVMQAQIKRPRGALDVEKNAALEAAWKAWGKRCDVTGKLSWRAVQTLCITTVARDGEFIARKIYGPYAGPQGFALQMIDPQRLPISYDNWRYDPDGNFVRHGIEYTRFGRPVAYHFNSVDEADAYFYVINGKGYVRVPADEIIHVFQAEMVGQRRGIPWASAGLMRLHHLNGFEQAAVQNARAGATKMMMFHWRDGYEPDPDNEVEEFHIDAEPLSSHIIPPGLEPHDFNPQYPSGEYAPFHKAQLRGFAAGTGVNYNTLASDLEGVNFSSIRQGTLDEREHWKDLQQFMIEELCIPVFEAWLKLQLLAGTIKVKGVPLSPERLNDYLDAVTWQGRRWQWIDPLKDVNAAIASIRAGLSSPSGFIRDQGRDPEQVFHEIADDMKQMKAAGIPDQYISLMMGIMAPAEPTPSNGEEEAASEKKNDKD